MGSTKFLAVIFIGLISTLPALPPVFAWKNCCCPPGYPPYHRPSPPGGHHPHPPKTPRPHPPPTTPRPRPPSPPRLRPPSPPPRVLPPIITPPPIISPPITNPPGIIPPIRPPPIITPPSPPGGGGGYPPYTPSPPGGGGGGGGGGVGVCPPAPTPAPPVTKCPIDALKLGLCLDVLGGLVHVIIGNPIENLCCPVIQGLLELEAAICLCTTIRLKLLNLNIFLPIALQVLATCGLTPPPGFVCPPLP